jgi:hypothetical protein
MITQHQTPISYGSNRIFLIFFHLCRPIDLALNEAVRSQFDTVQPSTRPSSQLHQGISTYGCESGSVQHCFGCRLSECMMIASSTLTRQYIEVVVEDCCVCCICGQMKMTPPTFYRLLIAFGRGVRPRIHIDRCRSESFVLN